MRRLPELIAFVLLLSLLYVRFPSTEYNRVIHSDGKGYYAHLPAIFIYSDLDYNFADEIEKKILPFLMAHFSKHFRFTFRGEIVNKTFSGIILLWLPFFLLAHLLTLLLGLPPDGYSVIYQISIAFSAIFYAWLGIKYLIKLFRTYKANDVQVAITIIAILFGTNYLYYVVFDPSLTHIYNFTLITILLYYVRNLSIEKSGKSILILSLTFGLILVIRPQNGFILFATPFVMGSKEGMMSFFVNLFQGLRQTISGIFIFLIIIAFPMFLWYLQTGHFLVYSYGNERFVFSNPQFFNVLFSYKKGLFVYSPLILLSLFGLIPLSRKNIFATIWLVIFLLLNTYIISSWEEWWYGCSYGHRVFIDFYPIAAILLVLLLQEINSVLWAKIVTGIIICITIPLNCIQIYQHYNSIVPSCDNNERLYWHNFLRFTLEANADSPSENLLIRKEFTGFEDNAKNWNVNPDYISEEIVFSGERSNFIDHNNLYSAEFKLSLNDRPIVILAESAIWSGTLQSKLQLVVEIRDSTGQTVDYQNIYIDQFLIKNKWITGKWKFELDKTQTGNLVKLYFWAPDLKSRIYFDDLKVSLYELK